MDWTIPLAHGASLRIQRTLVMGILNATPDSFSDGGRLATSDGIREAILRAKAGGADLLDVGGESTRPGHTPVAADEEIRRVVPVIVACRKFAPELPLSIDTSKARVAKAALEAGAAMVNDVRGLSDPAMAQVVLDAGCSIVLMRHLPLRGDAVTACHEELQALRLRAEAAGIPEEAVVLDPGLGFGDPPGSDPTTNLALIQRIQHYSQGRPVLIGASRKRFVGTLTNEPVPERRVAGSVAMALAAAEAGAAIVRVHDVRETVAALRP